MIFDQNAWQKTRKDHSKESAEDFVEAILRLGGGFDDATCQNASQVRTVDLVSYFGVSQPTVTKLLTRLESEGLVCIHRRRSIHLTEKGKQLAMTSLTRHELILQFLIKLGVSREQAQLDTEGIEHHVSDETLQAIRAFVGENT